MKGIEDHTGAIANPACHALLYAVAHMLQQGVHAVGQSGAVNHDAIGQYQAIC